MITEVLENAAPVEPEILTSIIDTFSFSYNGQIWTLLERLDSRKTFSAINEDETEMVLFDVRQLENVTWL